MEYVFGILPLNSDSTRALIFIDYTQPPFRLYADGISAILQQGHSNLQPSDGSDHLPSRREG